MKRAALLLLSALALTAVPACVDAAPVKGVKKICPDGSVIPYKKACPPTTTPPPPSPDPVPVVEAHGLSIGEASGPMNVIVTKTGTSSQPTTVNYATSNGTAVAGTDYTAKSGTLTFAAGGSSQQTVSISIHNNILDDGDRTFNFNLSGGTNNTIVNDPRVITIIDDDDAPPVDPPIDPTGTSNDIAAEGDSISVKWSGNYVGIYAAAHPTTPVNGLAVGGSTLANLVSRRSTVLTIDPKVFTVLIGANDLVGTTGAAYYTALEDYVDDIRAGGAKVAVATVLPQCGATSFNSKRADLNTLIRAGVGTDFDAVIDFAANSTIGDDADACNTTYYNVDGVHPTEAGQAIMGTIYEAVVTPLYTGTPNNANEPAESLEGYTWRTVTDHNYLNDLQTEVVNNRDAGIDPLGAFRLICGPSVAGYFDHVVYPGQDGRSHYHRFNGNTGVNANSTFGTLLNGNNKSTCQSGSPNASQLSVYWFPALLNSSGQEINFDFDSVYYKRVPKSNPICGTPTGTGFGPVGICIEIPNGLKMVAGSKLVAGQFTPANYTTQYARPVHFQCSAGGSGDYANLEQLTAGAPACSQLAEIAEFPDCWDGQYLWKVDRSHVVYPVNYNTDGKLRCPPTHPYLITKLTIHYYFTIKPGELAGLKLSSDSMDPTQPRGWSLHSDAHIVWDARVKRMFHDNCIERHLNCDGGDLGGGYRLKGAQQPIYGFTNPNRVVPVPPMPSNMVMP